MLDLRLTLGTVRVDIEDLYGGGAAACVEVTASGGHHNGGVAVLT